MRASRTPYFIWDYDLPDADLRAEVVPALLGNDAGMVGAALAAR